MANNKTKNVTLPLKSSLNMTRNTEIVSNTFDQLNKQNSPVFGGTLHPLHIYGIGHGEYAKYDKYGNRYSFSGNNLYQNSTILTNYNGCSYFTNTAHPEWPDYNEYNPSNGFGTRILDGVCYCYLGHNYTGICRDGSGTFISGVVQTRQVKWSNGGAAVLVLSVNPNSTEPYRLTAHATDGGILSDSGSFFLLNVASGDGGEGQYVSFQGSKLNGSTYNSQGGDAPVLNVSIQVNIDGKAGYVISVLNRKFKGENVYGSLQWRTAMLYYGTNYGAGLYVTYPGTSKPLALLPTPIPNGITEWYYDGSGNITSQNNVPQNNQSYNTGYIVCDGTDYCVLTGQWQSNRDDIRWVFPFSFRLGSCGLSSWNSSALGYIQSNYAVDRVVATTRQDGDRRRFSKIDNCDVATLTVNQRHARMTYVGRSGIGTDSASSITNVTIDQMDTSTAYAMAGFQSTITPSTTVSTWDDYDDVTKYSPFPAMYNSQGSIAPIKTYDGGSSGFRLLFNYRQGYISGISYGPDFQMGYLLTEWDTVDDEFYVQATANECVYKDAKTGIIHVLTRHDFSNNVDLLQIVDNRYVFVPVNAKNNCYDFVEKKFQTWGIDWNDRVLAGYKLTWDTGGAIYSYSLAYRELQNSFYTTGSMGSGVNVNYSISKQFCPSRITGYNSYNSIILGKESFFWAGGQWAVDYYGSTGTGSPVYRYTVVQSDGSNSSMRTQITGSAVGTTFPVPTSGTAYNNLPIADLKFTDGYNGKFGVSIGNTSYNIVYDGVRPIVLYNTTSMVNDADEFFIVQSQYYAVVNNYIAAISYSSSGSINGVEQIVDVTGMEFIGAFPSVAYFWSPANRSIFAFTGDADLQLFVQSNRITSITKHLYAPNNEWIYLATNDGMYVMTQMNVFRVDNYNSSNIHNFFATDKEYNIIELTDGTELRIALNRLDGYTTLPVELETEFFGPGDEKTAIIDCWYIRVWKGDEDDNGTVETKTYTLTNTVEETDARSYEIHNSDWDSRDSMYIRYQPRFQHAQGTSLYLKSSYPISYVGFSITDDTTQVSKVNI